MIVYPEQATGLPQRTQPVAPGGADADMNVFMDMAKRALRGF